jgi:hypothetical protein
MSGEIAGWYAFWTVLGLFAAFVAVFVLFTVLAVIRKGLSGVFGSDE